MACIELAGCDHRLLASHLALFGLAAILEESFDDIRIYWSGGTQPRPRVTVEGVGTTDLGNAVLDHARANEHWIDASFPEGDQKGLMSPRRSRIPDDALPTFFARKHSIIDKVVAAQQVTTLRQLGGLGQYGFWHRKRSGEAQPDLGASRLEMYEKLRGDDVVKDVYRKLRHTLLVHEMGSRSEDRTPEDVVTSLASEFPVCVPEQPQRPAPGLASNELIDHVVAWCALWGMSYFPVAAQTTNPRMARATSAFLSSGDACVCPVIIHPVRPAFARTILADARLTEAVDENVAGDAARAWLASRHVPAVMVFPIVDQGSNAAKRVAEFGVLHPTARQEESWNDG